MSDQQPDSLANAMAALERRVNWIRQMPMRAGLDPNDPDAALEWIQLIGDARRILFLWGHYKVDREHATFDVWRALLSRERFDQREERP